MIYAIHNITKEHSLVTWKRSDWDYDWRIVEADPDGWIPWHGGECPLPDGADFEAKRRDGAIIGKSTINFWGRGEKDRHSDIIAYRPILDADDKPEPVEWNGEGLPPVGCECEWKHKRADDDQWVTCQIVGYYDEWIFVVDGSNSGMPAVKKVATWRFRPIRSEEDRAVDQLMMDADLMRVQAERVYAAGYRKSAAADGEDV